MPDDVLTNEASLFTEEPLQFGEGGRLLGVLTQPPSRDTNSLPTFVFLSAGLLHRVGPFRLHVRLARELARMGFNSLRVDLAGVGDSPPRAGLASRESVLADFAAILQVLGTRVGRPPLVLGGLCTGADNAVHLALKEPRVTGMIMLDPVSFPDRATKSRLMLAKYTTPATYIAGLKRRIKRLEKSVDPLALRDPPSQEQMRAAFELIRERRGRVLSVFTRYALGYYCEAGHLGRVMEVERYEQFCTELFWPHVEHTYRLELHRSRLVDAIKKWAADYIPREL